MMWSLIDEFSFASWNMQNCIAFIHVLHFSLGLFPVVLLLLWVRLTAGRSHRLSGCSKQLRGLWSSWAKVNRIKLNDPGVWALSRLGEMKAMLGMQCWAVIWCRCGVCQGGEGGPGACGGDWNPLPSHTYGERTTAGWPLQLCCCSQIQVCV